MIRIYSDASLKNNVGCWSILICENTKQSIFTGIIDRPVSLTNNCLELIAVLKSIDVALKRKEKKVEIYTDSAYVVNAISRKDVYKWRENRWLKKDGNTIANSKEWKKFLNYMECAKRRNVSIKIIKVKAHSKNSMNNKIDRICRDTLNKYLS